jgi:hypothetical protein
LFAVREPFQSVRTQIGITSGIIKTQNSLTIESLMPTSGVIFSHGIEPRSLGHLIFQTVIARICNPRPQRE